MDAWFSTSTVLTEAAKKCHVWLESIIAEPPADEVFVDTQRACLPWDSTDGAGDELHNVLKEAILRLSEEKDVFLADTPASVSIDFSSAVAASASSVLEVDAALRQLRFQLVPRHVSEEQFWQRYFAAAGAVKQQVLASCHAMAGQTGGAAASPQSATTGASSGCGPAQAGRSAGDSATSCPAVPAHPVTRFSKAFSQVSSMAEGLLSPRSLMSEQTAAGTAVSMALDCSPAGAAAPPSAACCRRPTEAEVRQQATLVATGPPCSLVSDCTRLTGLQQGGSHESSKAAAAGAGRGDPQRQPPAIGRGRAQNGSRRRSAKHGRRRPDHAAAQFPAAPQCSNSRDSPSRQQGSGVVAACREDAAGESYQPHRMVDSSQADVQQQPPPQPLQRQKRDLHSQPQQNPPAMRRRPSTDVDEDSDAGGGSGRWSHASDQFLALSRELDELDSDWMVL